MNWILRIILTTAANMAALWLANQYVPGFVVNAIVNINWAQLILLAFILALLNWIIKPILTLILGPIIVITLGLGILIVNALILYALPIIADHLDFLHGSITIQSVLALVLGTLIVSVLNFVIHLIA